MLLDRLIIWLAALALVLSLDLLLGWGVAVGAGIVLFLYLDNERNAAKRRDFDRRQRLREAAWEAGDRRWDR